MSRYLVPILSVQRMKKSDVCIDSLVGVIMFGRGHDQPGVLIELGPSHAIDPRSEVDVVKARNVLWCVP